MSLHDPFVAVRATETAAAPSPREAQRAAETAGQLKATVVHGPNGTYIPTFYDEVANAFVPVFTE